MNRFATSKNGFNKAMNSFLFSNANLKLLPDCGWYDGGCRSLMKAIMIWLEEYNPIPYQIVKRETQRHSEHALVKLGDYYFLDASGMLSIGELSDYWMYEEGLCRSTDRLIIRPFDPETEPVHTNGEAPFYIGDEKISLLAERLEKRFDKEQIMHFFRIKARAS